MHDTDLPGELADPLSRELTGYNGNSSYCFLNPHPVLGITLRAHKTAQALSLLFLAGHAVNQAGKGAPKLTELYSLWPLLAIELPQTLSWGPELHACHRQQKRHSFFCCPGPWLQPRMGCLGGVFFPEDGFSHFHRISRQRESLEKSHLPSNLSDLRLHSRGFCLEPDLGMASTNMLHE